MNRKMQPHFGNKPRKPYMLDATVPQKWHRQAKTLLEYAYNPYLNWIAEGIVALCKYD